MNNLIFRSSIECMSTVLDCRRLMLSFHYNQLSKEQVIHAIESVINSVLTFAEDNFIFSWYENGKSVGISPNLRHFHKAICSGSPSRIGFDAYVITPHINNLSSLKKHQKNIQFSNPLYVSDWALDPWEEIDVLGYKQYIDSVFPLVRPNDQEILSKVIQIFNEPHKKSEGFHWHPDLRGFFTAVPHRNQATLYYGFCCISFSVFCLENKLDDIAERMTHLAVYLSNSCQNINAHVSLQPYSERGSCYMQYFGDHPIFDGSHASSNCTEEEWYPVYNLCGIEWLNILSPLAKQHVLPVHGNSINDHHTCIQTLDRGGLMVRSSKPINEFDYSDALNIKQILLPSLYPGRSSMPLRVLFPFLGASRVYGLCPRHHWEIVPVEKSELSIVGTDLVYTSGAII